ncbi:MAG: PmoA family protein [Pirellulales bacterium]|nr:PmoA family protein [Pirellulales bacterium]
MSRFILGLSFIIGLATSLHTTAAEFKVHTTDRGVTVDLDGKLFTEYLIKSGRKPILWPIIGPTGKAMTRAWPMDDAGAVSKDHSHHRSFWFSHGNVNGNDLWGEGKGTGSTEHREFIEVSGGKIAKIITKNDWLDHHGKKLAEDERTLKFSTDGNSRIIDFDITIKATVGDLKLGDTKEGTFALRVPDDFRLTANKDGRIVNSNGVEGVETWGKTASWVDYEGQIEAQTLGIAILNHPSSYGYPTHWHVRDYGLFAANPFGLHDFNGGNGESGEVSIKQGDTLHLRYRVILHQGNDTDAKIAEKFKEYSAVETSTLAPVKRKVAINGHSS